MPKRKSRLQGRDADSGEFISVEEARRRRKTAVVERIPLPRRRGKRKRKG